MPCPFSGLCVICFYRVCHTGFCTYKSVLSTVTVPDHSDMFLLLSLTLFIILLHLCWRRDEMDRLPRWLTRWMLASVKQRCFSVSSEIEKKWRERMLIPEVCVCVGVGAAIPRQRHLEGGVRRKHSFEISSLQRKEKENPTQSVSVNCMGKAINRVWL